MEKQCLSLVDASSITLEHGDRDEFIGESAILHSDKDNTLDPFVIPFIQENVDHVNLPKCSSASSYESYEQSPFSSKLRLGNSLSETNNGAGGSERSSLCGHASLSPSLFSKHQSLSSGEIAQEPTNQFYDLSLPNLQEVMDDDIMSPHVLSTPSTISSVGLSFQRSSPYESSSLYKNHPIPSFSTDYYPELLSSRSCGYSGFSPFSSPYDMEYPLNLESFSSHDGVHDEPIITSLPDLVTNHHSDYPSSPSTDLSSYKGHIFEMAKDHSKCRVIQELLDSLHPKEIEEVYCEIRPVLFELMTDPCGNYLFQKMLSISSDDRIFDMVQCIGAYLVSACCNVHGTRSVQNIITSSKNGAVMSQVMRLIKDHVVFLSMNSNGNHVIQRCLQCYPDYYCRCIYEEILQSCYEICIHRYGCCVMQQCFLAAPTSYRVQFFSTIFQYANRLINHPFGNYVIQYVLENGTRNEFQTLSQCVLGSVVEYSCQKYSSNVIEKVVIMGGGYLHRAIITELIQSDQFSSLLHHGFANYVIQRLLSVCDNSNKALLVKSILPYEMELGKSTGGRHILLLLQNLTGK